MPNLYNTSVGQHALRAKETTQFGTRKLAFYTFTTWNFDIVTDWDQPNSFYSRIVRGLQEAGIELFWLGQPHAYDEDFYNNWNYLIPSGTNSFTFAIKDESDIGYKYLESTSTYTVLGANQDDYINFLKIDNNPYSGGDWLNIGQPIDFGMTDDGVEAFKTYYIHDLQYDYGYTYIQLSESVTQSNNDNTPDYPPGMGHPGPVFNLNPAPSSNTYGAKVYWYDTYWSGQAGDVQFTCCWHPVYKSIIGYDLEQHLNRTLGRSDFNVWRCQDTFGTFPISCLSQI